MFEWKVPFACVREWLGATGSETPKQTSRRGCGIQKNNVFTWQTVRDELTQNQGLTQTTQGKRHRWKQ